MADKITSNFHSKNIFSKTEIFNPSDIILSLFPPHSMVYCIFNGNSELQGFTALKLCY